MTLLFVDMDGTLARFHDEVQYLERMFEKGFFLGLKPFGEAVRAVNSLAEAADDEHRYVFCGGRRHGHSRQNSRHRQ